MKASEILELVRAGFTKAEILKLQSGAPDEKPEAPAPTPEASGDPEPKDSEQPEEESAPESDPYESRFKTINETLDKMTKTMQAIAIRDSKQPEQKQESAADVLDKISKMYNT